MKENGEEGLGRAGLAPLFGRKFGGAVSTGHLLSRMLIDKATNLLARNSRAVVRS
jgi:hypothetical protein